MTVPTQNTLDSSVLSVLSVLVSVSLEMHAQMTYDSAPFSFIRFAGEMVDANMILADANLSDYEMALTDALANHPQRTISGPVIQTIYRNLFVLQRMARKDGAS